MVRWVAVAVLVCLTNAQAQTIADRTAANLKRTDLYKLKESVLLEIKDPSSAQFASLYYGRYGLICGNINIKNEYGAYRGFIPFLYDAYKDKIYISSKSDSKSDEEARLGIERLEIIARVCQK